MPLSDWSDAHREAPARHIASFLGSNAHIRGAAPFGLTTYRAHV